MNNKGKASTFIVVFLLVSFSFALLGGIAYYYISYDKEKNMRMQLAEELANVQKNKDKIQNLLNEAKKQEIVLDKKIKENQNTIEQLNKKLVAANESNSTLQEQKKELNTEINQLKEEKDSFKLRLENRLQELTDLQTRLQEMIAERRELEKSVIASKEKAVEQKEISEKGEELEKIVVTPSAVAEQEQAAAVENNIETIEEIMPLIENYVSVVEESTQAEIPTEVTENVQQSILKSELAATVILINRDHSFLVLDAGKSNGVEQGDKFEVFHGDQLVGIVQTEKVHDGLSAAKFLEGFNIELASERDIAKRIN